MMGPLDRVSGSNLIGVAIACGGNVLISLALTLQKLAHRQNEESVRDQSGPNSPDEGDSSDEHTRRNDTDGETHGARIKNGSALPNGHSRSHGNRAKPTSSPIPEEETPSPSPRTPSSSTSLFASTSKSQDKTRRREDGEGAPTLLSGNPDEDGAEYELELDVDMERGEGHEAADGQVNGQEPGRKVKLAAVPVIVADPAEPRPRDSTADRSHLESFDEDNTNNCTNDDDHGESRHSENIADEERSHKSDDYSSHNDTNNDNSNGGNNGQVNESMYLRSKLWWCGMALIAIGEGGNFLSYGFAPASVVAPLGTVALIANCIFAPLILRERFHRRELFGMALAILGAVTVVWSSNGSNPRLNPSQLITALKRLPFIIYTILNIVFLALLILLSNSNFGQKYLYVDLGITCLFGGFTVLSTKALSSLLSNDFVAAWESWITWVLVAVVAGTSVGQIRWLNRALMRFQSKEVIPTQFVFFSLAAIIGSAVLFQEFDGVPFSKFVNFAFGIGTTFLGVYLLTTTPNSDSDSNDDSNSDTDPNEPLHSDGREVSTHDTGHSAAGTKSQPRAQRASSSASLNLLLPSRSSASTSERTPLLIPLVSNRNSYTSSGPSGRQAHAQALGGLSRNSPSSPKNPPYTIVGQGIVSPSASSTAQGLGQTRIKLTKRTSTNEFTTTLGLGSQAGLLLMATTPPPGSNMNMGSNTSLNLNLIRNPSFGNLGTLGRGRSASRVRSAAVAAGQNQGHGQGQGDEERRTESQANSRAASLSRSKGTGAEAERIDQKKVKKRGSITALREE